MRSMAALLIGTTILLPLAGCRSCDLVEAELRTKERELRETRDELGKAELYNEALLNELRAVRTPGAPTPEACAQAYGVKEIVLGRATGGYDEDGKPGDDALQVVVEPRDPDGHDIKAPGSLQVEATQISPEGLKTPLCAWDIPPAQLRRSWRSGLFANGYYLVLPWKVCPTSTRVRVTARLCVTDGRVFETDKDVTVRLSPGGILKSGPELVPDAGVPVPLPAPRMAPADGGAEAAGPWLNPVSWKRSATLPGPVELRRPEAHR